MKRFSSSFKTGEMLLLKGLENLIVWKRVNLFENPVEKRLKGSRIYEELSKGNKK